jgi:hypothetical protein
LTTTPADRREDRRADPPTWPRAVDRSVLWGDSAPGVLVARLPSARPVYEPLVVTTLRRYVRRGASERLLHRIAGSAAHFRTLVRVWDLDGRSLRRALQLLPAERPAPAPRSEAGGATGGGGEVGVVLSIPERRLALFQVIAEYARAGAAMPTTARLSRFFGVSPGTIDNDIDCLRGDGRIACSLAADVHGPRRVIRLVPPAGARA